MSTRDTGEQIVNLARKNQRTDDLRRLREFRDDLPRDHAERPGVIRAIEVLNFLPLREEDEPRPHAAERQALAGDRPAEGTCGVIIARNPVQFCAEPFGHHLPDVPHSKPTP